jgi:tRNA-splicing ligase RtcB
MKRAKKDGENFNGLCMYSMDSIEGNQYFNDMHWAFLYANKNRECIIKTVLSLLGLEYKNYKQDMINETHNHAEHIGNKRFLHRKGATPAEKGVMGIIPGNMRDGVFVTIGLGNEEWLNSASHGAGRTMSRTKAKKVIDFQKVLKELEELDITVDITENNMDESPIAYKDVFKVIKAQEGITVDIVDRFVPKIVHIG